MAKDNATPGTTFTGPIQIVAPPNAAAFAALTPVTLDEVGDTSGGDESATINANFAAIEAQLNALIERLA